MRKTATLLALLALPSVASAQIYAPEGINIVGAIQDPDWQNPPPQSGFVFALDTQPGPGSGTGTYKSGVLQAGSGGFDAGTNLEWLFTSGPTSGPDAEPYRNTWKDISVIMNVPQTYTWQGSGNNTVSPVAGRYYVVRFLDNGYASTQAVWSELTSAPVTISSVSDNRATLPSGNDMTVTVNLSAAPSSESVYVRYTTDGYATSGVVMANCGGTATCTAQIPAAAVQEPTISDNSYYAFTSTSGPAADGSDAAIKTINNSSTVTLPVELATFTARTDGPLVRLAWTTASETNNAGFSVEQRDGQAGSAASAQAWREVAFVAGRGTSAEARTYTHAVSNLAPGRYAFRLRQVDFDGTASYSPVVEVEVGLASAYALEVRGSGVRVRVQAPQVVRVEAFDVLGRRVAVLHAGEVSSVLDVSLPVSLSAGVYVVRVTGETFATARSVVRTR